jgi:lipopolysaccharide transport system ATP-binding protein
MSSELAIRAEGLGKRYRIGSRQPSYGNFRETVMDFFAAPFRRAGRILRGEGSAADLGETIWALKGVSFEVSRGEVVGIIGRNGAGKSTLLKVLSRITEPTEGLADIYGRVGSLLEVGTGFHPELTGRENIYLNGSILGMKHAEIDNKLEEIVAFAGIEKFIDTPVKFFSSGMYLRLAFAVASHLDPDILFVDEVLAVGDLEFQKKCLGRMEHISGEGRTVVFVSHNLAAIQSLCERVLVLDDGEIAYQGPTDEAIQHYTRSVSARSVDRDLANHPGRPAYVETPVLKRLRLLNVEGEKTQVFAMGEDITFEVVLEADRPLCDVYVGLGINNWAGVRLCTLNSRQQSRARLDVRGTCTLRCTWQDCLLLEGSYTVEAWLKKSMEPVDLVVDAARFEITQGDVHGTGKVQTGIGMFEARATWEIPP